MPGTSTRDDATRGWVVEVVGHRVGEAARTGEIVEVLGPADGPHYRVRWADGHESLVYPGSDVVLRPPRKPSAKEKKEGGRPATRTRR